MNKVDVIIIGGGPAGATTAALVAETGRKVLVLERDQFPRFRIGESLMPGTYWTLQRLGLFDQMKKSAFVKKRSVQFYGRSGRAGAPFYFSENEPGERAQTWQVLRSEFDQLMLENARQKGADVRHGVQVVDVLFEGERAVGVRARLQDKSIQAFYAQVVVDASGQRALLSRKLRISTEEPRLQNAAIYSHFEGAARDEGIDGGATIIFHTQDGSSWFWYIPLHRNVVSIGVVGHIDYLLRRRKQGARAIFDEELAKCPALSPRLAGARQLFPLKTTKEFSYTADRIAGPGWVLVGDAFGFLDPIYSSGIFLALKSGEMAADAINDAFENDDFSAARLGAFAQEYLAGAEAIRKLVYAFYTREFSFARFLKQYPHCRKDIINILVGNVYREPVNGLFERMEAFGVQSS
ncbi:MAG: NAD(P)/FAD-dependent oxidoreductase [bacterium]